MKTFLALWMWRQQRGGLLCRIDFTIDDGITGVYLLHGFFFYFSFSFNNEPIQWHLFCILLRILHYMVIKRINTPWTSQQAYSGTVFHIIFHRFTHFTHLLNLSWSKKFIDLFFLVLLCRWALLHNFLALGDEDPQSLSKKKGKNTGLLVITKYSVSLATHIVKHDTFIKLKCIRNVCSSCTTLTVQVSLHSKV